MNFAEQDQETRPALSHQLLIDVDLQRIKIYDATSKHILRRLFFEKFGMTKSKCR